MTTEPPEKAKEGGHRGWVVTSACVAVPSWPSLHQDYSVEGMSDSLLNFLQHLREFGLVFQRKRRSRRYYPTRLAINLSSGVSGAGGTVHQPGFIVVETNYRLYAYTESELQIALIALFSEMLYRFPNMVVAQVTRESVQQAIASGITAQQVSLHGLEVRRRAVLVLGGKVFLSLRHSLRSVRGAGESPG